VKIRIQEQYPGELQERAEDAVTVLEKLVNRQLVKAEPPELPHQTKAQWEYPAVKGSYDRRSKEADRIGKVMREKLLSVLE
jgi:hypothetical protein